MERIDEQDLDAQSSQFDLLVDVSPGIDRFCSSTDWILPAHHALMPPREFFSFRGERLWYAGAIRTLEGGLRLLEPLEASWALACPFVGLHSASQARALVAWLRSVTDEWDVTLVAGLLEGEKPLRWVAGLLQDHFRLRVGDPTPRYVADLRDGVDAYLARRSRNFRRAARRTSKRAREEGIELVPAHAASIQQADGVYERILAVEERSWKGRAHVGINIGGMGEFYRQMGRRLAAHDGHRCWFAVRDGADVGYVLGGVRGTHYRGLQFSYDEEVGDSSIGNFMQLEQMVALHREGIESYDLGSEADYKRRWADQRVCSPVIFAFRGG